jgi:hypothetical protein
VSDAKGGEETGSIFQLAKRRREPEPEGQRAAARAVSPLCEGAADEDAEGEYTDGFAAGEVKYLNSSIDTMIAMRMPKRMS